MSDVESKLIQWDGIIRRPQPMMGERTKEHCPSGGNYLLQVQIFSRVNTSLDAC